MSRQIVIDDADSFAKAVRMSTDAIYVSVMSQADNDSILNDLKLAEFWLSIPSMPGIFNTHCVQVIGCQESRVVTDDQQCRLLLFRRSIVEFLVSDANQVATKTRLLHSSNKLHCYRANCIYLHATES